MSLYTELKSADIIAPVVEKFNVGDFTWDRDGKIVVRIYPTVENGFVFAKHPEDRATGCFYWLHIFFGRYGVVSPECQGCWKIVAKPKTLAQLFALHNLQLKMGMPSKCGIEQRPYVSRLYGGYWYVPLGASLEEAQAQHRLVRNRVRNEVGEDVEVILKKACTEMEQRYGDTGNWKFSQENQLMYERLKKAYAMNEELSVDNELKRMHTMVMWIEWAANHNDPTYKSFATDVLFDVPYRDYQSDDKIVLLSEESA
jgi:hypothetical protein